MFTEEDYREYLEEVITMEQTMVDFYEDLAERIGDEALSAEFTELVEEEATHYLRLRGLQSLPASEGED